MEKIICNVCEGRIDTVSSKIEIDENDILTRFQTGYCAKCGVRHDWEEKFNFIEQNIVKVWSN